MTEVVKKTSRGELTREKILNSAEKIFAEKGFAVARLEDVAQEVGIRRASIVYYFKDKQELYDAVESRLYLALEEAIQQALIDTATTVEKLLAIVDSSLDFMVSQPSLPRFILRNISDIYPAGSDPVRFSRMTVEIWIRTIQEGQEKGEICPINPIQFVNLVGGGILNYATTGTLFGEDHRYQPDKSSDLEAYRELLHRTTYALMSVEPHD